MPIATESTSAASPSGYHAVVLGLLLLNCGFISEAQAQYSQEGSKLTATDAIGNASQGKSVAVSADGNTVIAGGPDDDGGVGAAWIYVRSAGVWSQQAKLVGSDAVGKTAQGWSVALSADGNTAIVGGPSLSTTVLTSTGVGAAWVFTRSGGKWSEQAKMIGTSAAGNSVQGRSVALSADGNTAAVGGSGDNSGTGAVWVYTRSGGKWSQQGSKLVCSGYSLFPGFGTSVAISADGDTLIGGGPNDAFNGVGAIWAFTRSAGAWRQQGGKLVGSGSGYYSSQGVSVAISADGNTAIAGGSADTGSIGAAWVYTRTGGAWRQQGDRLVGATGAPYMVPGARVALSGHGNTAILGGSGDNSSAGAAWVYKRTDGVWSRQGDKLVGTGAVGSAKQGESVALSADGGTLVVGGMADGHVIVPNVIEPVVAWPGATWVFAGPASAPAPSIAANGVVNGASFQPGIVGNSWVTIQGSDLAPVTDTWANSIVDGKLPTTLDGVTVTVGGKAAYLYYISPSQINLIAPDTGTGPVPVTVTTSAGTSLTFTVASSQYGPAFFTWPGDQAVATRQDFTLAVRNGTFGAATNAAKPGEVIILWGTGFGPTAPAAPTGVQIPANQTYLTSTLPSVSSNNVAATVYGAALAPGFAGLYQVAIQVPSSIADGDWPLIATIGGVRSPSTTVLSVRR